MANELRVEEIPEIAETKATLSRVQIFLNELIDISGVEVEGNFIDHTCFELTFKHVSTSSNIHVQIFQDKCYCFCAMFWTDINTYECEDPKEMGEMICNELKKLLHA